MRGKKGGAKIVLAELTAAGMWTSPGTSGGLPPGDGVGNARGKGCRANLHRSSREGGGGEAAARHPPRPPTGGAATASPPLGEGGQVGVDTARGWTEGATDGTAPMTTGTTDMGGATRPGKEGAERGGPPQSGLEQSGRGGGVGQGSQGAPTRGAGRQGVAGVVRAALDQQGHRVAAWQGQLLPCGPPQ